MMIMSSRKLDYNLLGGLRHGHGTLSYLSLYNEVYSLKTEKCFHLTHINICKKSDFTGTDTQTLDLRFPLR
jgi:hypothetical protein